MFRYISEILSQFSTPQKITALSILLLSIVIISIAPSFISAITLDKGELNNKITSQNNRIKDLQKDVDSLEFKIRNNEKECTNQIIYREEEFLKMLDKLKEDLINHNNNLDKKIVKESFTLVNNNKNYNDTILMGIPENEYKKQEKIIIYKKPEISSTLLMIDSMKEKIKKN